MMRKYIYGDESGNFDFSNNRGASRYFILTTVAFDDHSLANRLGELRRDMAWDRPDSALGFFNATNDEQRVRDAVFEVIGKYDFRVDATILEKRRAFPEFHQDEVSFYDFAWRHHVKFVVPEVALPGDELLVVAASIRIKKKQAAFRAAIRQVMREVSTTNEFRCAMWGAAVDTSLQIADYCAWAIQRKWELGDDWSHRLIQDKIRSEFDLFAGMGETFY